MTSFRLKLVVYFLLLSLLPLAAASARALARSPAFQRALAAHDTSALERAVRSSANIVVEARGGFRVGSEPARVAERRADVVGRRGLVGTVIAWVPLGSSFLEQLRTRSGLQSSDAIVLLRNGRIVAGPAGLRGRVATPPGVMRTIKIGRVRYRALVA